LDEQQDFAVLACRVKALTGIDLSRYKPNQMHRRLGALMARRGCTSFAEYAHRLETDAAALQQFVDRVTINVSELFRNPEKFAQLEADFLRPLASQSGALTIWSAGCSYGAEIYSVVMQLEAIAPGRPHRYLATDIDSTILERARAGRFAAQDVRSVSPERLRRHFTQEGDLHIISPAVRSKVQFRKHDLLQDAFPPRVHLVLCRNVVIYFTDEAKDTLYRRFFDSLVPGGVLFMGGADRIPNAREIGFESPKPFFYMRPRERDPGPHDRVAASRSVPRGVRTP